MAQPQVKSVRIRMAFDISQWSQSKATDVITSAPPQFPTGSDMSLEMLFCYGTLSDANVIDMSVYTSVVVALQSTNVPHEGTTYWSSTISSGSFVACTYTQFTAAQPNTNAQITAAIANSVWSALSLSSNNSYWMVIYGITTDTPAKYVPFAAFALSVADTGMPVGSSILAPSLSGYQSYLCSDGLYRKAGIQLMPDGVTWNLIILDQNGSASP